MQRKRGGESQNPGNGTLFFDFRAQPSALGNCVGVRVAAAALENYSYWWCDPRNLHSDLRSLLWSANKETRGHAVILAAYAAAALN